MADFTAADLKRVETEMLQEDRTSTFGSQSSTARSVAELRELRDDVKLSRTRARNGGARWHVFARPTSGLRGYRR